MIATRRSIDVASSASLVIAMAVACGGAKAVETPAPAPATRVEVQIGLCGTPESIERALALQPQGPPFEVWLFDNDALTLYGRGLRIRLRAAKDLSQLTLKIANQDCATPPANAIPPGAGKCEYDVHGANVAGAVSLTRTLTAPQSKRLVAGRDSVATLLSDEQIAYLKDVVHLWPLPAKVRALGPIDERSYRAAPKRYDVGVSKLPKGETFIEISTKVPVAQLADAKQTLEHDLARAGVSACADQSAQAINKLRSLVR